jgi:hypothetical protein
MSPRHFSSRYGPYFRNDGFTRHNDYIPPAKVSIIDGIKALFKSRPKKKTDNPVRHYEGPEKIPGSFAGSKDSITKLPLI